ncbi:MAG: hypothetical protein L0Y58_17630 [Verrucomicrobia subdivision 3 bacterium]|nr:hypothetical protein [Limisphaerales bacterium]
MRVTLPLAIFIVSTGFCADATLEKEATHALARAIAYFQSISTRGGYLWWYSEDLKERAGENKATESQIWVQPPGTPSVGLALLRAWEATKDPLHLAAAQAAAEGLAWGQLESGGWTYLVDFNPSNQRWYRRAERGSLSEAQISKRRNVTTFDDDTTQSALRFLMAAAEAAPTNRQIRAALEYGLQGLLRAQYPNGGWPQGFDGRLRKGRVDVSRRAANPEKWSRTPDVKDYWQQYTFNDDAMRDIILTLLEAHRRYSKPEYLAAVRRGGDFILLAQLPEPQAAWAQQYNFEMEPAWARRFEPPALCSGETGGIIRTLVDLYLATHDEKYLKPIPSAIEWLERSQIAPRKWARFYELGSNKPLYFTKDYQLVYTDDDLPTHYAFQGEFRIPAAIAFYERVRQGRGSVESLKREPLNRFNDLTIQRLNALSPSPGPSEARVREIISTLDPKGRWIAKGRIESRVFIANVNALCDYLTTSK